MFIFGIFLLFSVRGPWIPLSQDLEIQPNTKPNTHNLSKLLLSKANLTLNNTGMDMRVSNNTFELEISISSIRKNMAKKQLLIFLEDHMKSELQKIEKMQDPEHAEYTNPTTGLHGFRIEAGGLWRDWEDTLFLFL